MNEEYEVKFINVDPKTIQTKLKKLGAKKIFDRIYKIYVFDYPDFRLDDQHSWVRLRDEGDKITLTFKRRLSTEKEFSGKNDKGMEEYETVVSDFEATHKIFMNIGMIQKFYEEKRRVRYILDDMEFDLDFCPGLDPYLEIESNSWANVDKAIELLGLDINDKKIFSTSQIYKLKGIRMLDYKELSFRGMFLRDK